MTWKESQNWRRRNHDKGFLVEVYHWISDGVTEGSQGRGPHRWNVYAYIYPNHVCYEELKAEPTRLEMPNGVSFNQVESVDGVECCVKIGNDYDHLWNQRETWAVTPDEAANVFADAEEIYRTLSEGEIRETPKSFIDAVAEGFAMEAEKQ